MNAPEPEIRNFPFQPPADQLGIESMFTYLRQNEPVSRVRLPYGGDAWLVTRYRDVRAVLSDRRFGRAATTRSDVARIQPQPGGEGVLMSLDPPEHTRLRRNVVHAFTARRVADLRPATERTARRLLDAMVASDGPADLIADYAVPLPVHVICHLLGVPVADQPQFTEWSDALLSTTAATAEEVSDAAEALAAYFGELVARRRRRPSDDLIGKLVELCDNEDGALSEHELVTITRDLLLAGHETTSSQIGNFAYILLHQPHQLRMLRERPELISQAVEELMRYISLGSGGFRCRVAVEDVDLSGVLIKAGEAVFAPTIAANRDPEVFDEPDRIDITRTDNPHVGFGHGAHHCIGAQLARMELAVAIAELVRRFPDLELAAAEGELKWKTGMQIRGLEEMPIRW